MKNRIVIHIGPPKSGTSAIQYALSKNRCILREHGVEYPDHDLGANGISSGNLQSILHINNDNKWVVCEDKIKKLIDDFDASNASLLILSSEYFFSLVQELASAIPSAQFIAYIRCPLETFESAYNQSVKRHKRTKPISLGKVLHNTTLNNLSQNIESIGSKRFILRAYFPVSEPDFDLVEDFFKALDFLSLPLSLSKHATNTSYSAEALEFKRWLNQFDLDSILDSQVDSVLQAYEGDVKDFSLLPQKFYARYQRQALIYVRGFIRTYKVFNGNKLLAILKNPSSLTHQKQVLTDAQFELICLYLQDEHSSLYSELCVQLSHSDFVPASDRRRLDKFLENFKKRQTFLFKLKARLMNLIV